MNPNNPAHRAKAMSGRKDTGPIARAPADGSDKRVHDPFTTGEPIEPVAGIYLGQSTYPHQRPCPVKFDIPPPVMREGAPTECDGNVPAGCDAARDWCGPSDVLMTSGLMMREPPVFTLIDEPSQIASDWQPDPPFGLRFTLPDEPSWHDSGDRRRHDDIDPIKRARWEGVFVGIPIGIVLMMAAVAWRSFGTLLP